MKKYLFTAITFFSVLACAMPTWGLDVDFSGSYRVRGFTNSNVILDGSPGKDVATASYWDMRFRLKTDFTVTENLSVTTRFDALNKNWGTSDNPSDTLTAGQPSEKNNIDWDVAYMTIKTPVGGILAGRFNGAPWGTPFGDSNTFDDQIVYVLPIGNFTFAALARKMSEDDGDNNPNSGAPLHYLNGWTVSDADNDRYYITGSYKTENFKTGLLCTYYNMKNFVDAGSSKTTALGLSGAPVEAGVYVFDPYFIGKFGDFGLQGEWFYGFGEIDYPAIGGAVYADGTPVPNIPENFLSPTGESRDIKVWAFDMMGTYDLGPFVFEGGYAVASGAVLGADNGSEYNGFGFVEQSDEWGKAFLINGYWDGFNEIDNLGGPGLGSTGKRLGRSAAAGFNEWYLGLTYKPLDNLDFVFRYINAKADKVFEGGYGADPWDDDYGNEYDLYVNWTPYENLKLSLVGAYLDAGDYWKGGYLPTINPFTGQPGTPVAIEVKEKVDDNMCLYANLTLSF